MGIAGEASLDSNGSQKLLWLVLLVGWKVSPLRMDMFWKESRRAREGSLALAGRRRGFVEVDMLMEGRAGGGDSTREMR